MGEPDLSDAEREMLQAADSVVVDAERKLELAARCGSGELIGQRELELKVAIEWAALVRQEINAGKLR